jgi:predicted DNA-binding protein
MKTTINFRIEVKFKEELENLAEEREEKLSTFVREIIIDYLHYSEYLEFEEFKESIDFYNRLPITEITFRPSQETLDNYHNQNSKLW